MFSYFKKNKTYKKKQANPLYDLQGQPIAEGDQVQSLRYDLGICEVVLIDSQIHYKCVSSPDRKVHYAKMVDAITGNQKVYKI